MTAVRPKGKLPHSTSGAGSLEFARKGNSRIRPTHEDAEFAGRGNSDIPCGNRGRGCRRIGAFGQSWPARLRPSPKPATVQLGGGGCKRIGSYWRGSITHGVAPALVVPSVQIGPALAVQLGHPSHPGLRRCNLRGGAGTAEDTGPGGGGGPGTPLSPAEDITEDIAEDVTMAWLLFGTSSHIRLQSRRAHPVCRLPLALFNSATSVEAMPEACTRRPVGYFFFLEPGRCQKSIRLV